MSACKIERWLRPEILALCGYHVTPAAGLVKLDAMENPYSWPEELRAEWTRSLSAVTVNRYPDPEAADLKAALRNFLQIPSSLSVMLGNGSDELLQIVMMGLCRPGSKIVVPEPTFSMYRILAETLGMHYVGVPLQAHNFELNVQAMQEAVQAHEPALLVLCYPNNPTGNLFDADAVAALVEAAPGLVLIDEAYFHFARRSMLPALAGNDNVLVLRTLSKLGLAGLRVGLLAGPHPWLQEFEKIRLPYNINVLSQAATVFMLEHAEVLEAQAAQILADRERLLDELQGRHGRVQVWPSATNFLLLRIKGAGQSLSKGLIQQGVLVKNMHGTHALLEDCMRVTVGTQEENAAFVTALDACL